MNIFRRVQQDFQNKLNQVKNSKSKQDQKNKNQQKQVDKEIRNMQIILSKNLKQLFQLQKKNLFICQRQIFQFTTQNKGDTPNNSTESNSTQSQSRDKFFNTEKKHNNQNKNHSNQNNNYSNQNNNNYKQSYDKNNSTTPQQNPNKTTPKFNLNNDIKFEDKQMKDNILLKYRDLCEQGNFKSKEFADIKKDIIEQIKNQVNFKHLIKYFKNLNKYEFQDRELMNALALQADKLKKSYETLDTNYMIMGCSVLCSKYNYINKENQQIVDSLLKITLDNINKQQVQTYKTIEFGLNSLGSLYIEDIQIYNNLINHFEKQIYSLNDAQFIALTTKLLKVLAKLRMNETYHTTCISIKQRIRNFMLKPQTIERIISITKQPLQDKQNAQQDQNIVKDQDQHILIGRIAVMLSKQMNMLKQSNNIDKNNNKQQIQEENDQEDEDIQINDEISQQYQLVWKQIEQFIQKYYKSFNDITFRTLLLAIVSSRSGSEELYSQLFKDFHKRVSSKPAERIDNDFYCLCLRSFYTSRVSPLLIEQYEKTFTDYTKKKLPSLNTANKMTIFSTYSTIGDQDMIKYIIENKMFTITEVNQLNRIGRIQFFWSMANIQFLKEDYYSQFLLVENDPKDQFFKESIKSLIQVSQIYQSVKVYQQEFWNKNQEILENKFEKFQELSYNHHSLPIQQKSEYKQKTAGSLDVSDILNAMKIEFYFEPIVDKIFNVDFILKGINKERITEFKEKKSLIIQQFKEIQVQEQRKVQKYNQKNSINKENDILLEIDGRNHFLSKTKTRQATQSKIDILSKLGYKIIQINSFELLKIAQTNDKDLAAEKMYMMLLDKIQTTQSSS